MKFLNFIDFGLGFHYLIVSKPNVIPFIFLHPEALGSPCVATPDFLHAAMRPDMITETEVEISTEDCCEEEDEEMVTLLEEPEPEGGHEPVRKRKGKKIKLKSCTSHSEMFSSSCGSFCPL